MPFRFVFNHLDPSQSLMDYTEGKLEHVIRKYVGRKVAVRVSFSRLRQIRVAHCDLLGAYGAVLHAEDRAPSAYGAVNKMASRLARQLKKQKDVIKGHKPLGHKFRRRRLGQRVEALE